MSPPPNSTDAFGQGSGGSGGSTRRLRRDRTTPVPSDHHQQTSSSPVKETMAPKGKENSSDNADDQDLAARLNRLRSTGTAASGTAKRPAVKVKVPPTPVISSSQSQSKSRSAASSDNDNDDDSDSNDSITPNQSLSQTPPPTSAAQVDLSTLISTIHANIDSTSASTLAALSTAVSSIPPGTPPALLPANHPRRTPLHAAIMRKNPQAVSTLLSNAALAAAWCNMADHAGITPLVLCLRSKKTFNMAILRALLAAGASAFGPATPFALGDSAGGKSKKPAAAAADDAFTPLDVLAWAMQHITADTDASVFDQLVADARKHGVLDQVTNEGYGALHLAVNLGSSAHVKSLLDVGAMDPSSARNRKWPVVHFAACNNQLSALHLLFDAGCPANLPAHDGQTPLHAAAAAGHLPVIDYLVANGGDPTARDNNGWMPVTWALDALCKRGRRKSTSSTEGNEEDDEEDVLDMFETLWTHLHSALSAGDNETPVALAKVVANKTKQGESLVDMALVHGRVEVAVWLMSMHGVRSERLAGVGDVDVLGAAMNMLADQVAGAMAEVRRIKQEREKEKEEKDKVAADETQCIVIDSDGEEEVQVQQIMATPSARAKGKDKARGESRLAALNLSPIRVQPPAVAAAAAAAEPSSDDRMDIDPPALPPVPRLRPILPAAPGRYPTPAIRVAMPEDAARVLVAALDSHLGDVAGLDATTPMGPLDPEAYLAGDHMCGDTVARIQGMVRALAAGAGVTSGLDAVVPALDRALDVAQAHPMVDVEPALAVMQVAIGKHMDMVERGTKVIVDMQAADSDVRAAANEAAKDLAEFTRLQEAREYLGALRAEDRWMGKQLAMLARRGELLRSVQRAAGKQAGVVDGITAGAQWADNELDKMAVAVEEKTRAVEVRVKELAGVRERVRMAVSALEVEWQAKIAGRGGVQNEDEDEDVEGDEGEARHHLRMSGAAPAGTQQTTVSWLLEFCSLFLHMERMLARESGKDATGPTSRDSGAVGGTSALANDDDRHPPTHVLSRMLQWYLEAKSGEAQAQHKAMSTCLRALQAHAETLTLVRRATEWTTGAMLAHVRSGLNTLQGHAGNLKQAIPATYEELHARLVFNERLCKRNCKEMQAELRTVLDTKNKAFESRRLQDLTRCDELVRHLHEALEKEEKRLVAIEELMQRAFAAVHRHLDQERVEQLQQEYLELGVLLKFNVPPSGVTAGSGVRSSKKRGRSGAPSPAPSSVASHSSTGLGVGAESSTAGSSTVRGTLPSSSLSMLMGGPTKYESQDDDDEDIRSDDGFVSFLMSPPPRKVRRTSGSAAATSWQSYSHASATAYGFSRERQLQAEDEEQAAAAAAAAAADAAQPQPGVLRRALTAPVDAVKSIFSFSWFPTWSSSTDASAQQPLEAGRGPADDDTIPDAEYRSRLRALTQTHYRRNTMRPASASADTSTVSSMAGSTADDTTLNSVFLDLGNQSMVSDTTSGEHGRQSYHQEQQQGADDLSLLDGDDSF